MSNALNRAERYHDLAEECRCLAAISSWRGPSGPKKKKNGPTARSSPTIRS